MLFVTDIVALPTSQDVSGFSVQGKVAEDADVVVLVGRTAVVGTASVAASVSSTLAVGTSVMVCVAVGGRGVSVGGTGVLVGMAAAVWVNIS